MTDTVFEEQEDSSRAKSSTDGILRAINFSPEYRTGLNNPIEDLYHPALRYCTDYWRAVGFFSSTALEVIGAPLGEFVARGGRMRLVTSVRLSEEDIRAIASGLDRRQVCEQRLLEDIRSGFESPLGRGAYLLTSLLAAGRLEIRIALPTRGAGIYHEKVGIFLAADGDYVTFTGSSNESRTAFEANYECIDVFTSWKDQERALPKREHFQHLWEGVAPGVEILSFPEAARRALLVKHQEAIDAHRSTHPTKTAELWFHQREAVEIFLSKKIGVLEMATGTGKTRIALHLISILVSKDVSSVIVAADGNDLLEQWAKQLFSLAGIIQPRFRVLRHFGPNHDRESFELDPDNAILVLSRQSLAPALKRIPANTRRRLFLIHDEVHRLGSAGNVALLDGLADDVPYRLGLSATPDREYDQVGNSFIAKHIGPLIYRFELHDAIRRGVLCEFQYDPVEFELTLEDRQRQQAVFGQRSARAASGNPMSDEEFYMALSKVVKLSKAKLPLLASLVSAQPGILDRCIVFVEDREYGDQVAEIIHSVRHNYHTYYHDDDTEKLADFANGNIDCLLTCHRLSEGIDIRSLRSVILMSSNRARLETIQRMGRCLRRDPADPKKRARVIDFVQRQTPGEPPNADQERKAWLLGLAATKTEDADANP